MTTPEAKQSLKTPRLLELIEKAKDAEACRDMDSVRKILRPVWPDSRKKPGFNSYGEPIRAELLRLAGFCLAYQGFSKGRKDCQERGRDLLTNAIDLFETLESPHKLAEAKIFLALCYWYEGALEESEAILQDAEARYDGNREHDVYLQICYYRMITHTVKGNYDEASRIMKDLKRLIKDCKTTRIIALVHTEAGVESRRRKKYDEARFHIDKAIACAKELDNGSLLAANLNNLAYLYMSTGHFELAHECVDEAILINKTLKQTGFLAHKYDTKAVIYFEARDYENALETVDKSIELARQGEDYSGLCDALFDKSKILLRLGRSGQGLLYFAELVEIAHIRLGQEAIERYAADFAKLVYPKRGVAYREEVRLFQKDLIRNALLDSGKITAKTKELLSVSQQGLSEILNKQFPELCDELGIERRGSRRKIRPVVVHKMTLPGFDTSRLVTFEVFKEKLPQLELDRDVVVAVLKGVNQEIGPGKFFFVQCRVRNVLECGLVQRLDPLDLLYFENDGDPCPFTPKDVKIIGEIVGYCHVDELDSGTANFKPIR